MKHIHFVGIGGAGMAPLAEIMLQRGVCVSGSDREANGKTEKLTKLGARVAIGHAAENVPPETELIVYSSAVPADNPERRLGIREMRRGEFLAEVAKAYKRPVAVSGSHGKSSITALLVHLLGSAKSEPGFLIGAEVRGAPSASAGQGDDLFIMEVDESDGTHTLIHPYLGIVPNVEDDHSWSVGGDEQLFRNFLTFAEQSERLLYYPGAHADRLFADHPAAERLAFPVRGQYGMGFPGFLGTNLHLALRAAELLGVHGCSPEGFGGVARRMTLRSASERLTVIEDYAHHPTELARSIEALRMNYPEHHLRVVFQPHRYARLQKYLPELAEELRKADSAVITPVFAAWSEQGPCGGAELAEAAGAEYIEADWSEIARKALVYDGGRPLLLAVIGAGDIDQIFAFLP